MKILFAVGMIVLFSFAFIKGIEKQEIIDCYKAQKQSEDFSEFFFMNQAWKNTCDAHEIKIDSKFVRPVNFRETR